MPLSRVNSMAASAMEGLQRSSLSDLEVTSGKKEKKRKLRHLFNLQMIVPSSLRLKGALWSVERATRGACLLADGLLLDGLIMVERRS